MSSVKFWCTYGSIHALIGNAVIVAIMFSCSPIPYLVIATTLLRNGCAFCASFEAASMAGE